MDKRTLTPQQRKAYNDGREAFDKQRSQTQDANMPNGKNGKLDPNGKYKSDETVDDFINNGPGKGGSTKEHGPTQEPPISTKDGPIQDGPTEGPGGDPGTDGGSKEKGMPIIYKIIDPPKGPIGPGDEPIDGPIVEPTNPGKGEKYVNSLGGKEIFDQVQDTIKKLNDEGKKVAKLINNESNTHPSDRDKRAMMRRMIDDGLKSKAITAGKTPGDNNMLAFDPTQWMNLPMINWEEVLEDFLEEVGKEEVSNWYGDAFKHGDLEQEFAHRHTYEIPNNAIGHIVFCVDTSGSVSKEKINLFLDQIGAILEGCPYDEIVVDVVKCSYAKLTIDRFLHHPGEFKEEAKIIRQDGERGGTDYTNALMYFHYMMMDESDREANNYEDFLKEVTDGGVHVVGECELDEIPPASGFIYFTDTDFFNAGKYYGTMEAESAPFEEFINRLIIFIGIDGDDVRRYRIDMDCMPIKYDEIFADRIKICSLASFWGEYTRRFPIKAMIKESADMGGFGLKRREIGSFHAKDEDEFELPNKTEQKPNIDDIIDAVEIRDKRNYQKDNMSLVSALELSGIPFELNSDGIVTIKTKGIILDEEKMSILSTAYGDLSFYVDGDIIVTGGNIAFFENYCALNSKEFDIIFKDDANITIDQYNNIVSRYDANKNSASHRIKYINCKKITTQLLEEAKAHYVESNDQNAYFVERQHSFTNDLSLLFRYGYYEAYIDALLKEDEVPQTGISYVVIENGEIIRTITRVKSKDITNVPNNAFIAIAVQNGGGYVGFCINSGGVNSQKQNSKYVDDGYTGFPPFVIFKAKTLSWIGKPKPKEIDVPVDGKLDLLRYI